MICTDIKKVIDTLNIESISQKNMESLKNTSNGMDVVLFFSATRFVFRINSLIDLVFIFDIIINFRTTKIDAYNGEVIIDPYNIAKHYVSSV